MKARVNLESALSQQGTHDKAIAACKNGVACAPIR